MRRLKILIIDDYPHMVEMLKVRLEASGFEVLFSYDGVEGLQTARTQKPDLIILDVLLPRMDGFKICRLLKFDEKFRKIPIIMVTSRAREIDRKTGLDMGADAYIYKPYDALTLMEKIQDLLSKNAHKEEKNLTESKSIAI